MRRLLLLLLAPLLALPLAAATCGPPACDRTASPSNFGAQYAATAAGEALCLNNGSYGDVTLGKSITLENAPNQSPVLRTLNITADNSAAIGLEVTGGGDPLVTVAQAASHVDIVDNSIHGGSGNGMRNRGDYVLVQGNDFYDFGSEDAIRLWGDHHSYINNFIHDVSNGGHNDAFQTYRTSPGDEPVTNLTLDGNTIRDFPGSNAHCFMVSESGQANWTITNNRFQDVGSHCLILGLHDTSNGVTNVQIHDNDFVRIGGTAIFCDGITSGSITGNTFQSVGGTVSRDSTSNCTGQQ